MLTTEGESVVGSDRRGKGGVSGWRACWGEVWEWGVEKTDQAGKEAERLTGCGWREGGRLG